MHEEELGRRLPQQDGQADIVLIGRLAHRSELTAR
jgi:hypothetical protein